MKPVSVVISCEHGVNWIPEPFQPYFADYQSLLATHRGIDFGALALANYLSKSLDCRCIRAKVSRLLIDHNRSLNHRDCFSEASRNLSPAEKNSLIQTYYLPYRTEVETVIRETLTKKTFVLHLSIHSFTPVLHDLKRNAEIGLLYDPKRQSEKRIALQWQQLLRNADPSLRVRRNYPYKGIADGFTTSLRKLFSDKEYAGIELEINQNLTNNEQNFALLMDLVARSLIKLIG